MAEIQSIWWIDLVIFRFGWRHPVQFRVPHSVLGYLFAQGCDACQEEAAAVTGTWTSLGWYPWCHGPILSGSPVDSSPPLPKGSTSLHTGCPHFAPSLSLITGSFGTQETWELAPRLLGDGDRPSWPGCTFLCSCPGRPTHAGVTSPPSLGPCSHMGSPPFRHPQHRWRGQPVSTPHAFPLPHLRGGRAKENALQLKSQEFNAFVRFCKGNFPLRQWWIAPCCLGWRKAPRV